jgi:hypothetical protein
MKTILLIIINLVVLSSVLNAPAQPPFEVAPDIIWDDTLDSTYVDKYGDTTYTKKDETWKVYY